MSARSHRAGPPDRAGADGTPDILRERAAPGAVRPLPARTTTGTGADKGERT
ncbi:hypothetical protein [Streptomyces sp. NPDC059168]|uniref:hypothetical protein n=1 Tax=Streptomyces sp. NPDC059168 TaxID=3346753 RepID=UPI003690B96A